MCFERCAQQVVALLLLARSAYGRLFEYFLVSCRGKIAIKSRKGAGTLVTVFLPLTQPEEAADPAEMAHAEVMLPLKDFENLDEPEGDGEAKEEIIDTTGIRARSMRSLISPHRASSMPGVEVCSENT
jgi:hypothetical protein